MSPRARKPWGEFPPPDPHVWNTLRYRGVEQADGRAVIEWDAPPEYCFHSPSGPIVHGGMVAALLDTAMGGACWTLVEDDEDFLTADLRTEFHRSARPGTLRAEGHVVQRTGASSLRRRAVPGRRARRERPLHPDRAPRTGRLPSHDIQARGRSHRRRLKGLLVGPDASAGANRDARLRVLLSRRRAAASKVVRILRIACRSGTWDDALQAKLDVLPVVLRPTSRAAL